MLRPAGPGQAAPRPDLRLSVGGDQLQDFDSRFGGTAAGMRQDRVAASGARPRREDQESNAIARPRLARPQPAQGRFVEEPHPAVGAPEQKLQGSADKHTTAENDYLCRGGGKLRSHSSSPSSRVCLVTASAHDGLETEAVHPPNGTSCLYFWEFLSGPSWVRTRGGCGELKGPY